MSDSMTSNERSLQAILLALINGVRSVNIGRREWYEHIAQPLQDAYQALGGPKELGLTPEEIEKMRDESPVETDGWQPIETAPNDQSILVARLYRGVRSVEFIEAEDNHYKWPPYQEDGWNRVTHWMPCPAPPGSPMEPT